MKKKDKLNGVSKKLDKIYIKNNKEEDDMSTSALKNDIILNEVSAKKIATKIDRDLRNDAVFEYIDVKEKIKEGTKILRKFLSH